MNFKVESLAGWCEQSKAQALYDLVIQTNSQLTVEVGAFAGRSLIPMALAHKEKKSGGHWIIDDCDWVEAKEGYSKLPDYGFELVTDYTKWQIWKKK